MVGIAEREFECNLCQQQFTLFSGDLILPMPNICDECLREVWDLEGEALAKHVAGCLADGEKMPADKIIQYIGWHKEQWSSAEDAIQSRKSMFGTMR